MLPQPRPPPASAGDAEQEQAYHLSSIVDGERRESRYVEEDCGGTPNMKQARSNATNTKRTASSLPPNNFIGSDEHSADAPHYTTASSLGADQLLSAFYRYHFFFTAIPLIFALVHTSFRGEGDLCVFDGVSLGVYLSGVRGAGAASAVFDERTDQQREFGVPLDAAWVTAEFLLGASVFNVGAWWVLITISGAVQVEEREEEAKTVTSGVFASSLLCFIAPYCLVGGGGTYLTLSAEDPEKRNSMRVILTLLVPLLVLLWIAADRARHRCTASKQPRRGRTIFCVAKFVFAYTLWGGLTLIFGIQFVIILFPAVLRSVQDWPPLWKSAVELLATGFYFILWIPLMEKAGGKIILPMVLPQRHDFDCQRTRGRHSQTQPQTLDSVAPPYYTASTASEHASDFFSRDEKIASTLRRRKDGFQFFLQNNFDLLRFVFGRGMLSQLSPFTFAALLVYDAIYHFWHFALRQQESLLVFSIRVSRATWSGFEYGSPNSFESHLFRLMSGLQRLTQLPRKLAVSFEEKYDFLADERARQAFYSGETSCDMQSVWFSFCNVRLVVENVPTELLRSVCCPVALPFAEGSSVLGPAQRTNQTHQSSSRDARSAHHEVTDSKAAAAPVGNISSSGGRGAAHEGQGGTLLNCEANDQIAPGTADVTPAASAARAAPKERLSTADAVTSTVSTTSCQSAHTFEIAKQRSVHVNRSVSIRFQRAVFGKMLASFFPSVSCEDSERLEGFVRFFRKKNFVRYQIRAQVRILVSLVMIFVPLVSRGGNVYYYAGFPQDDSTWMKLIAAALVFLAKDLLEWYVITFKFMLCSEWRIEQFVPALFNEIGNPGFECRRYTYDGMAQAVAMGVLGSAAYFCALMFALRWNAYNMLEIQTVTGHRDLEWKEVYGFCKEGGVA